MKLRDIVLQCKTWGMKGIIEALMRKPWEYHVKRVLEKNAKRNADTTPVRGITIVAPISGAFSLSKTMRDFVVRLSDADVPCQVFDTHKPDGKVAKEDYAHLITPTADFNLLKYDHVVEMLSSPLPTGLPLKRCRIAFWEGECGLLETFPYLKDSDTVIAMSDYNANYFRRELPGSVRVAKVQYPLLPLPDNILGKTEARKRFDLPEEGFVVFYNFDIRAEYRKNSLGTLRAFSSAFKGNNKCLLVLKINGASQETEMEKLTTTIEHLGLAEQVVTVTEYLSQIDLYALTNACDVYLSLHRAEGFGLGIAEAMQLGKPVVATNYSANTEFCNNETSIPIPYTLVQATGDRLFSNMRQCAEPDEKEAARALRRLYEDEALRTNLGRKAQAFVAAHYSKARFKESIEQFLKADGR